MLTSVSLWSTDLLNIGANIDKVDEVVNGFHIDVMDGHFVPELLFGPDVVRAVSRRTQRLVDVHLMVTDVDRWIDPFADAGAGMLTVHATSCVEVATTLAHIQKRGIRPAIAVEIDVPLDPFLALLESVDRVLLMGTQLGVKGVSIEPTIYDRLRTVIRYRDRTTRRPEIFVDGGIRRTTAPLIAQAGADGVTPGSLVFGDPDPVAIIQWLTALPD